MREAWASQLWRRTGGGRVVTCLSLPFSAGLLESRVPMPLGFRSTSPLWENRRWAEGAGRQLCPRSADGAARSKELNGGEKILGHVLRIVCRSPRLQGAQQRRQLGFRLPPPPGAPQLGCSCCCRPLLCKPMGVFLSPLEPGYESVRPSVL